MAIDMFLKIGNIVGESTDKVHEGELDVLAYSLGFSNSGTTHVDGGVGDGKVNAQDLSFTTYVSKATPALFFAVCNGRIFDTALLTVRKSGANPIDFLKIEMEQVLISSDSMGGSGGEDRLTENYSLNFAKLTMIYTGQDANGLPIDPPVSNGWDFALNVKLSAVLSGK